MVENGFYKISPRFIELINSQIGGRYSDAKTRPVFCCIEDRYLKGMFWGIPTSDWSHRSPRQQKKIADYCSLDINKDIRACYYHLADTDRPAIYRISNCLPIIDKYIDSPYISQGSPLFLKSTKDIKMIQKKLSRILWDEKNHPNKYEQHITDIQDFLKVQLP